LSSDFAEDTRAHIRQIAARLDAVCRELRARGEVHDQSKLSGEERPWYEAVIPRLKGLKWGTVECAEAIQALGPALGHHYAHNSHHPEHYNDGVRDMDLIDLIEMYCDWAAATLRSETGDLRRSIEINCKKYGIESPLRDIFLNTFERYGGFSGEPAANRLIASREEAQQSGEELGSWSVVRPRSTLRSSKHSQQIQSYPAPYL
jgi:hypothetical protein